MPMTIQKACFFCPLLQLLYNSTLELTLFVAQRVKHPTWHRNMNMLGFGLRDKALH